VRSKISYNVGKIRMRECIRDMLAEKGGDFVDERWKGGRLEELTLREGVLKKKDKGKS